jgi:hypothetical protein
MRTRTRIVVLLGAAALASALAVRHGGRARGRERASLLARYEHAPCLVPHRAPVNIERSWNEPVRLSDGSFVRLDALYAVSGRVEATFHNATLVIINPGDYIYPIDLRVDAARDLLYVKCVGSAGGFTPETWLYEYDLARRELIHRVLLEDRTQIPLCPTLPSEGRANSELQTDDLRHP